MQEQEQEQAQAQWPNCTPSQLKSERRSQPEVALAVAAGREPEQDASPQLLPPPPWRPPPS